MKQQCRNFMHYAVKHIHFLTDVPSVCMQLPNAEMTDVTSSCMQLPNAETTHLPSGCMQLPNAEMALDLEANEVEVKVLTGLASGTETTDCAPRRRSAV